MDSSLQLTLQLHDTGNRIIQGTISTCTYNQIKFLSIIVNVLCCYFRIPIGWIYFNCISCIRKNLDDINHLRLYNRFSGFWIHDK